MNKNRCGSENGFCQWGGATTFFAMLAMVLVMQGGAAFSQNKAVGLFEGHGDVGAVAKAGSVEYDSANKVYVVAGGGENMWFATDAFQFVWKRVSGDVSLASDIQWIGTGGNAHRKACLLIRQSLDPDSAYADAVVHGDGLTSLQWRDQKGGNTQEIRANVSGPRRIQITREGDFVFMSIASEGETLHPAGGSCKLKLSEPFYIGLGVCAHDNKAFEKARFSNVEIKAGSPSAGEPVLESTLERIPIPAGDRRAIYHVRGHIEAPNWSLDGKYLLYNSQGRIYRLPASGGRPNRSTQVLPTGVTMTTAFPRTARS